MRRILGTSGSILLLLGAVVTVGSSAVAAQTGPVGALDSVSEQGGRWALYGWAWDPAQAQPVVSAEVNGEPDGYTYSGAGARPDVVAAFPGAPENTGFALWLDRPLVGTVCAYSLSSTLQKTANLGCRVIPPPSLEGSPVGALDEITPDVGRITVSGWTSDPDAPNDDVYARFDRVEVYVDGRGFFGLRTGVARPDVDSAVPYAGPAAGFWVVLPARPGRHAVCVDALNAGGTGRDVSLGCRDVTVSTAKGSRAPFGFVDGVYVGAIHGTHNAEWGVTGWAAAPDQAVVDVRVVAVGGYLAQARDQFDGAGTTGESRPDVVAALPGTRADTGFHVIAGGGYQFGYTLACAIGHIAATGSEAVIGCVSDPRANPGF